MDTTETYIKMCDCEEIQAASPWNTIADMAEFENVYFGWKEDDGYYIENNRRIICQTYYEGLHQCVWLPRQDQLQEMLGDKVPWVLAKDFARKVYWSSADTDMSMEQLWLIFIMKELYQKVWTGKDWVNETLLPAMQALPERTG